MRLRATLLVALFLAVAPASLRSQSPDSSQRVRAFIDCNVFGCDDEFFRREILFVDHMREPQDASVHVLVTSEPTGGSGTAYTVNFLGKREFSNLSDTLRFVVPESATSDERRHKLSHFIQLGLLRYAAHGPAAEGLTVTYAAPATTTKAVAAHDRWNYWVFRTSANANLNGEQSAHSAYLNASQSANRITRNWKTRLTLNQGYSESKFKFEDGSGFSNYTHSFNLDQLLVKSVTAHFSAGELFSYGSSTFLNQKLAARIAPAVEYDLFPYEESSRHQLVVQYSIGAIRFKYNDTTIFNKIAETRVNQSLKLGVGFTQPWGSTSTALTASSFLDDNSKNRLELFNITDVRLFKGLSLNAFISASRVRDQLYLARGGATEQEILVRRRQLATSYSYFASLGLSYTFGSIFNNVVNPRFDGPSGSF
jgi:hypothetical protein